MPAQGFDDMRDVILRVQQSLWDVGADLAAPPSAADTYVARTSDEAASELEPLIDQFQSEAAKLDKFVLRQGHPAGAALHVACTVVRRAERAAVRLSEVEAVYPNTIRYLNRLSDLLFVMARAANARCEVSDTDYENSPSVFR